MILESAAGRSMGWPQADERHWDALYAHQLPRIYNYFRFRLGREADVEELTSHAASASTPQAPRAVIRVCPAERV